MISADFRLAEHASGVSYETISPAAAECAKKFLLDTIAVGIAGSRVPQAHTLGSTAQSWSGTPCVGVWGRATALDAPQAAMVNAYQVHCQEFDSIHEDAVIHAMATIIPVLLSKVAVTPGITGQALIAAIVAGADISCRLGLASQQGLRFFRPATSGGFGAVAALANINRFSAEQTLCAFGHQLAQTSGTMQGHTEGTPTLALQIGVNARASWFACDLAKAGMPSLQAPLTGKFGYLPLFENQFDLETELQDLGQRWCIEQISHKPYPSGRATHGGVEGLTLLLSAHALKAEQISSVTVHGPRLINHLVNRPAIPNPSASYARLCMPFVLAKVLQHGRLDLSHYSEAGLQDPDTFALSQKVRMVQDDNPDPNAFGPQKVCVELMDGTRYEHVLETVLASPARPLNRQQYLDKFLYCWSTAETKLSAPEPLIDMIDRLESCQDCQPLTAHLSKPHCATTFY
jgi:aconitate decarboxylase